MTFAKSTELVFSFSLISLLSFNIAAAQVDQLPPDTTLTTTTSVTTSTSPTTTTSTSSTSTTATTTSTTTTSTSTSPTTSSTGTTSTTDPVFQDLFPDLKVGSQYYIGVKYLKDLGLIQGYPDGKFVPLKLVNRAEALKILTGAIKFHSFVTAEVPIATLEASAEASTPATPTCPFPDLDKTAWYYSYVCGAFSDQVVSGYPDGTFKPEQNINRAEALKMDILQTGLSTYTTSPENFDDVLPTDWFYDYAKLANEKTFIVEDRSGNLTPGLEMNRGEFAMLIYRTIRAIKNGSEFGNATYYGGRFDGGTTTSGDTLQANLPTAAHKTLPFGTIVKVTNLTNGKSVEVRINDRGPYVDGAIIDLSTSAFQQIDSLSTGVVPSEVEVISQP